MKEQSSMVEEEAGKNFGHDIKYQAGSYRVSTSRGRLINLFLSVLVILSPRGFKD